MNDSFIIFVGLMKIFKIFQLKMLRKRASEIVRTVKLCNLDQVQKIGILWNEGDSKAYNYLHEQFKPAKVIIRNLCYTNNKDIDDSNMITSKDLNWLGFPGGGNIETFIQADFDLLLNLSVKHNFALDVITALSAAAFKIGWDREKLGFYDLTIDVSEKPEALFLAEQQIYYLKQFNKNSDL
jgi:hypothetical protein